MTDAHIEKETLSVEVNIPTHDKRVATAIFEHSRKLLIAKGAKCFVCGRNEAQSGHPLEAHHHPIERSFAEMIDWSEGSQIRRDYPNFDWRNFDASNPYSFVDDMLINGLMLCKEHHTQADTGIHTLPYPIFIAQRYGREGYQFNDVEILHFEAN